ncbi:hypothetical protein KTT_07740 [Tengunoibacter tsumagoiensis]|uniref:Uncharacterized protein n=1 Tax=Tengunoibacter tsumagoiensis TaxID=2014871 RepID=A0A401ZVI0_9CHLR|nr:hypothetical protein KTT_07740 [Tengunoibacter tsumagoiensis]
MWELSNPPPSPHRLGVRYVTGAEDTGCMLVRALSNTLRNLNGSVTQCFSVVNNPNGYCTCDSE